MVLPVADLRPGDCRRGAVIVEPGQGELVGSLDVAGDEGVHDVTALVSAQCLVRSGGWRWALGAVT
jgi:hypothetical protein